jgi:hypothetical protein
MANRRSRCVREYGFWVQDLSLEAVGDLYAKHHEGDDFESAFTNHFEGDLPESVNIDHHLVVVATGIDASTESAPQLGRHASLWVRLRWPWREVPQCDEQAVRGSPCLAEIPGTGYVGVGEVTAPAVAVNDFEVEVDGATMPILQADLKAPNMEEEADDPEQSEYLARVRWLDTRPREQAVWEKGMFANQNVVAKLRQPFTLQRLAEVFRVPADEDPR